MGGRKRRVQPAHSPSCEMPSLEYTSSSLLLLLKKAQEAAATRAPSGVRLLLPNATAHLAAEASMAAGLRSTCVLVPVQRPRMRTCAQSSCKVAKNAKKQDEKTADADVAENLRFQNPEITHKGIQQSKSCMLACCLLLIDRLDAGGDHNLLTSHFCSLL